MGFSVAEWRGGQIVVARRDGGARLWLDDEGELCDALGRRLTLYDPQERVDPCELVSYVARWIKEGADDEGPTSYWDIHPELRALVYTLVPSVIATCDDDWPSSTPPAI